MWDAIKDGIFWIIQQLAQVVGDWGLAIIIVTIIFRLIMTPIIFKQSESSYRMSKLNPELQRIKERYPNDPVRQNEETSKLYAETKFNPISGCVPMLIQIPIFMALFQTLREMGERSDLLMTFYNLVPNLAWTPENAMAQGVQTFVPYLLLVIIFAGATFIPMVLQQRDAPETKQKQQMYIMAAVMSVMMLWLGWGSPAGVLLFWGTSSLIAIAQQQIARYRLKKADEAAEAEIIEVKPIEVDVVRKQKKKRQSKKR